MRAYTPYLLVFYGHPTRSIGIPANPAFTPDTTRYCTTYSSKSVFYVPFLVGISQQQFGFSKGRGQLDHPLRATASHLHAIYDSYSYHDLLAATFLFHQSPY